MIMFPADFNIRVFLIISITGLSILASCTGDSYSKTLKINDSYFRGKVHVEKNTRIDRFSVSIHNYRTGGKDIIYTPYRVFNAESGDINGDGRTDICLGIVKPTPFDSVLKRRLFIFQIEKDYIRPLWLGSRLARPLINFRVIPSDDGTAHVMAIEQEGKKYRVSEYRWGTFGMQLVKIHKSLVTFSEARELVYNNNHKT